MTPERKAQYEHFGFDVDDRPEGWFYRGINGDTWFGPHKDELAIIMMLCQHATDELGVMLDELRRRLTTN